MPPVIRLSRCVRLSATAASGTKTKMERKARVLGVRCRNDDGRSTVRTCSEEDHGEKIAAREGSERKEGSMFPVPKSLPICELKLVEERPPPESRGSRQHLPKKLVIWEHRRARRANRGIPLTGVPFSRPGFSPAS